MFKKFILLSLLIYTTQNIAQNNNAHEETGTWYILSTNNKISEKWSIPAQSQFRFYELASELQQFKVRVGANYKFTENFSGYLGYGYFRNDFSYLAEIPANFDEHRLVADINLSNALGSFNVAHRYRFEQRIFGDDAQITTGSWMRYMLKVSYPFAPNWSVDVYDEVFINTKEPMFAQNWLGGGFSYTFSKTIKARLGYQRIMFDGPDFNRILLGINFTTDFTKDEDS